MQPTEITNALNPLRLLDIFIDFAPYILSVLGILIGLGIIFWSIARLLTAISPEMMTDFWWKEDKDKMGMHRRFPKWFK